MSIDPLSTIGPVATAATLAWSIYKSCKAAPKSFKNISTEVLSLHGLLREVEETLVDRPLSTSSQERLDAILGGCQSVLGDLEALVKKCESLGTKSARAWYWLQWDPVKIAELRDRLTSNTNLLDTFLSTRQVVIEKKLDLLLQEFRAGRHEASIISVATIESLAQDEQETWRMIRKELENIGISIAMFDSNKEFILKWFQQAILTGAFKEENIPDSSDLDTDDDNLLASSQKVSRLPSITYGEETETSTEPTLAAPRQNLTVSTSLARIPDPGEGPSQKAKPRDAIDKPVSLAIPREHPPATWRLPRIVTLLARLRGYNNAFNKACAQNDLIKAAQLLDKGVNINAVYTGGSIGRGETALLQAAGQCNVVTVSWLVDHGADIHAKDPHENTPLHRAIAHDTSKLEDEARMLKVVDLLIFHEADINPKDFEGFTPLHRAAGRGCESAMRQLLQHGALSNTKANNGRTPLIEALCSGSKTILRLLLESGAGVNVVTSNETPALSIAVEEGKTDMVQLLLDHGAKPNCSASNGQYLLAWALHHQRMKIAKLLIKAGGVKGHSLYCILPYVRTIKN